MSTDKNLLELGQLIPSFHIFHYLDQLCTKLFRISGSILEFFPRFQVPSNNRSLYEWRESCKGVIQGFPDDREVRLVSSRPSMERQWRFPFPRSFSVFSLLLIFVFSFGFLYLIQTLRLSYFMIELWFRKKDRKKD